MKFKLILGLGNPGLAYQNTYHNVGLLALQHFTNKLPKKQSGVIFVKPDVFMNESGRAAVEALRYFKIKPEEMLVVHDDSDIALGDYKLSFDRGAAGHKGIESIIKTLGHKRFWRLRIGIRKRAGGKGQRAKRLKASELVLRKITAEDKKILYSVFETTKSKLIENATLPAEIGTNEVMGS